MAAKRGFTREEMLSMLLWGGVGGMLPSVGRIAASFGANFSTPAIEMTGVAGALLLYGAIGAVMARAMEHPGMRQALFAGISAPAIMASVLNGLSDGVSTRLPNAPNQKRVSEVTVGPGLYPLLRLADYIPELDEQTWFATVHTRSEGASPIEGSVQVAFEGCLGEGGPTRMIDDAKYEFSGIGRCHSIAFNGQEVKLDGDKTLVVLLMYPKASTMRDFLWTLGFRRVYELGSVRPIRWPDGVPLPQKNTPLS